MKHWQKLAKISYFVRPISLLASISDFDRQAAVIVEQRLKDEEKRRRVNDESFYVQTKNSSNNSNENPPKEPQEAIDEIMANVDQKMVCLDAIGKHNDRWEKRISNDIPNIDMNGLVSDLNQFLNTTKKELMTPKTKRKKEIQQQMEEETKQMKQDPQESSPEEKPKPQELSPASKRKQEIRQAKQLVEEESKQMKQKKSSISPASKRKQLVQQAKKQIEEESKQLEQIKQKTKVKEKGEKEIQEVNALLQECTQALKLEEKQKENKSKQNPAASAAIGEITDKNNGNDHAKCEDTMGMGNISYFFLPLILEEIPFNFFGGYYLAALGIGIGTCTVFHLFLLSQGEFLKPKIEHII